MREDELLGSAFDDFAATAGPALKFADAEEISANGRGRQRRRLVLALSTIAVLLVAVPVTAQVLLRGQQSLPNPPATTAPSVSPSPSPTLLPFVDLENSLFSRAQLIGLTVEIPLLSPADEDCAGGKVTLRDKAPNTGEYLVGQELVYTNLDGDPALETVVRVECTLGDPPLMWLLALDEDASGHVVVLSTILGHGSDEVRMVRNLAARQGGGIDVDVCFDPCAPTATFHGRQYYWQDGKFARENRPG